MMWFWQEFSLKFIFDTFGLCIWSIINKSLTQGGVSSSLKRKKRKKPGLDHSGLQNFHLISKHPFIAKILEKVVFWQLSSFLAEINIMDKIQSGFKTVHTTEFALIRVLNGIFLEATMETVSALSCQTWVQLLTRWITLFC